MTDSTLATVVPVVTQTTMQKYGAGIYSFLFSLLTAIVGLTFVHGNFAAALQIIPIIVTGALTWLIPLGTGRWPGIFKTGLEILSIVAVVLLPIVLSTPWPWPMLTWVLIGLAILKASAVEFHIQIRSASERAITLGS